MPPSGTNSYYIIRHAEKEVSQNTDDPLLSPAGEQRAQLVCESLINKNIGHIFCTHFKRSKATAEPLSRQLNLPNRIYDPSDLDLLDKKLKKIKVKSVLVIGHNNTIGVTCNKLAGKTLAPEIIDEMVYDNYYTVQYSRTPVLKITCEISKYGVATP